MVGSMVKIIRMKNMKSLCEDILFLINHLHKRFYSTFKLFINIDLKLYFSVRLLFTSLIWQTVLTISQQPFIAQMPFCIQYDWEDPFLPVI